MNGGSMIFECFVTVRTRDSMGENEFIKKLKLPFFPRKGDFIIEHGVELKVDCSTWDISKDIGGITFKDRVVAADEMQCASDELTDVGWKTLKTNTHK